MSYYVKRQHRETGRVSYVGPIRSLRQADKEVAAWVGTGSYRVWLQESDAGVRAAVRTWEQQKPVFEPLPA